jgi:hypothetical protein
MDFISPLVKRLYNRLFADEVKAQLDEISNLKADVERLKAGLQIEFPSTLNTITIGEIYPMLKGISSEVYISDEWFNLTSQEEASKFSEETHVQYASWVQENHDCDNFSFALLGYWSEGLKSFAFGAAWSARHAFNIMVDSNKEVWIIEPQTNKWTKLEEIRENEMYYPIRLIIM